MVVDTGGRRVLDHPSVSGSLLVDLGRTLSFDRCISKRLVHRRSVAEVFVCDRLPAAADLLAVAVELPRAHSLWSDHDPRCHDPSMIVEAVRQAAIVAAHDRFEIPITHVMIARSFGMKVTDIGSFANDARNPLTGIVLMATEPIHISDGAVGGMQFTATVFVSDIAAAELTGELRFAAQEDFATARALSSAGMIPAEGENEPQELVAASSVGRTDQRNVVIAGPVRGNSNGNGTGNCNGNGTTRYRLLVDQDNAAFFDHELDHVPGLLMTEGARQVAAIAIQAHPRWSGQGAALVTAGSGRFDGFAELGRPTDLVLGAVTASGACGIAEVFIRQSASTIAEVSVELTGIAT